MMVGIVHHSNLSLESFQIFHQRPRIGNSCYGEYDILRCENVKKGDIGRFFRKNRHKISITELAEEQSLIGE